MIFLSLKVWISSHLSGMREKKLPRHLSWLIGTVVVFSLMATVMGIFSNEGTGPYLHKSIRNTDVLIHGRGLYRHMSAEVAPQGIAQDFVTLFIAIPVLLISFFVARRGSRRGTVVLCGTLFYFFVSYLFYLVMGMYNAMFLIYVVLAGTSFFSFIRVLGSFDASLFRQAFSNNAPAGLAGTFLVLVAVSIGLLWLSIVVPPLLDGSIVPKETAHYTTLIVQGLDLSLLLPAAVISGVLLIRKKMEGFLYTSVYLVFLSLLMTALTAKLIAMAILGYPVVPAIFIIPVFNLCSVGMAIALIRSIQEVPAHSR
jgi:hypothetical protein